MLVMGVAGSGKSQLARALAEALRADFIEGDAHHPEANRLKMQQGQPLNDADRAPWLQTLGHLLAQASGPVVLACSALKADHRESLRAQAPGLVTVYLSIDRAMARQRVQDRPGHWFPAALVDSQFEALQAPLHEPHVITLPASWPTERQVAGVLSARPPHSAPEAR